MSKQGGFWYMAIATVYTVIRWLDARFSRRARAIRKTDAKLRKAIKQKNRAEAQAALDRLRRKP